ncbi:MAG: hypothetical protein JSV64_01020 [Candidatus Bathyarchaeota archaeon]|jgi:glycine cleavage system H protein|nr:MAG: hypothetical protein JSV64_01020 [Candidatus Bathyarchaeota archaeon]
MPLEESAQEPKYLTKWKTVRVRLELWDAVERTLETGRYRSLSEFVSDAIQTRLSELKQDRENESILHARYPMIHERLLCSRNHLWAMVTPEGNVRVGLTNHAQTHLKAALSIQTSPVASGITREKPFGVIETWMFVFDLYAPVSGKIVKLNSALLEKPLLLNEVPYESGWIAEIKPNNVITLEEELRDLMGPNQYKLWFTKLTHFGRPRSEAPK